MSTPEQKAYAAQAFADARAAIDRGDQVAAAQILTHAALEAGHSGPDGFTQGWADLHEAAKNASEE